MDYLQQWCDSCASVREFVLVPAGEPVEFACTACDAALIIPGGRSADGRAALLV